MSEPSERETGSPTDLLAFPERAPLRSASFSEVDLRCDGKYGHGRNTGMPTSTPLCLSPTTITHRLVGGHGHVQSNSCPGDMPVQELSPEDEEVVPPLPSNRLKLKLGSSGEEESSSDSTKASAEEEKEEGRQRDLFVRTQSLHSALGGKWRSSTSGRFYKRPLRGPYGAMLEQKMSSGDTRDMSLGQDLDETHFPRNTKSSSPTPFREPPREEGRGGGRKVISRDDIHIHRSTTTDASPGQSSSFVFHQRTSSSPAEIPYTTETTTTPAPRKRLEGSPRGHVLAEIVETEKSYVDALRTLVHKYMEPLKKTSSMEDGVVDEIFFQVPTILWHHDRLLDALQRRVLDDTVSVGDVFLEAFRQTSLLECYTLFIRNWENAKGSLKVCLASSPSFVAFLDKTARQHKGKLSLDALLICPVQRIPRYELLLKELLKQTKTTHDDHSRLLLVLEKLRKFALHIDCASIDPPRDSSRELEVEGWGGGLGHVISFDILPLSTTGSNSRKDRAILLLQDTLLIASIKKGPSRKSSSKTAVSSAWEGSKFKLVTKGGLGEVGVLQEDDVPLIGSPEEVDDVRTIHRLMDLASTLKTPHTSLDDCLREMLAARSTPNLTTAEDTVHIQLRAGEGSEGPEQVRIFFGTVEKKRVWLDTFNDTLAKFLGLRRSPGVEFLEAVPIRKTRAGLLLSCAAPVPRVSQNVKEGKGEVNDVWIGNSDGYVGQVCILSLEPEPGITSCNGVCNSRITCILAVPSSEEEEEETTSVWLGTEDGGLHIYDSGDSLRVKKHRQKIQHKAPLNSLVYFGGRVFLALANGENAFYSRNPHGKWATGEPSWLLIGSPMAPVTTMLCVGREVWCAASSSIKVYREHNGMLELVHSWQVAAVTALATTDDWVWTAFHGIPTLKAFHARTFELMHELNLAPHVAQTLAGSDEIIRQHKTACLRLTALLVSPDKKTLWVGTSAGVILTLTPPNSTDVKVTPLPHGHTGQVRFLTSSERREESLVISGGDGFEEFPIAPSSVSSSLATLGDPSGREDSTNHILIWKTPPT